MKNATNIFGTLLVLSIIAFIITMIVININPEERQKVQINSKLTEDEMIMLIKYAQHHITRSNNLENNSITDESMIIFALDYMNVVGGYDVINTTEYIKAKRLDVEAVVKYIFDKDINYSNVTFDINGDYILAPVYPTGTDAQIYKFKSREYDEIENTYIVSIDCLEVGSSRYSEIIEGNVTDYDEKYVIKTLLFKYKEIDGRRVLLAYNSIFNMNF